jgi:polyisoprenyl-teichoic acid--peptidoglycan teichoic acid transferase
VTSRIDQSVTAETTSPRAAPLARRPLALAAVLTFIWPGLGQWFQGRRTWAKLFALPLLPVLVLGALLLKDGFESAALRLFDPTLALIVLVIVILAAAWRLAALGELVLTSRGRTNVRRVELVIVLALSVLVIETHTIVGNFAWSFYQAGSAIFDTGRPTPTPLPSGETPQPSGAPGFTPLPTPATALSRINVLLIGVDSSSTRTQALTDTMIVASVDPVTGATSMVSFPRDIAEFPMYDGGVFQGKINSFTTYAGNHPKDFPEGAVPALMHELGFLLGIPIHYYASVNLEGFVKVVDAMGHVTIDNARAIEDFGYGGWTDGRPVGFHLSKGVHQLDGQEALAYARSRKGAGDSDFTRAARQQELLQAVRRRLTDPALLPNLPTILAAAAETLRTNFPPDRLSEMLLLARRVDDAGTHRVVMGPPYSVHPPSNTTGGTYILRLKLDQVKALSIELYGQDSAYWSATGGGGVPGTSPSPQP